MVSSFHNLSIQKHKKIYIEIVSSFGITTWISKISGAGTVILTLRYNQQLYRCSTATRPENSSHSQANQYYECNGTDSLIGWNCASTSDEISIHSLSPTDRLYLSTITVIPISGTPIIIDQYICIVNDGACGHNDDIAKLDLNSGTLTYGASLTTNCIGLLNLFKIH